MHFRRKAKLELADREPEDQALVGLANFFGSGFIPLPPFCKKEAGSH